jgi:spermidine/putrescine transport system substrate-binding protein
MKKHQDQDMKEFRMNRPQSATRTPLRKAFPMTAIAIALAVTTMVGPAAAQTKQLLVYSWANYIPPALLKRFETETGIQVSLDVYSSNNSMLAKLQAGGGGYDIVVPSNSILATMIRTGLVQKVDASNMPNYKNVAAPHDHPQEDKNRDYSVPYLWGSTGFTYDSAKVPGGKLDDSWKEFFEPRPELVGKIAAMKDQGEMFTAAAIYLGIDTCTENPADAQKILELLEKQKPAVKIYSSSGTIGRMQSGEVVMHQQWNGAAHRVKEKLKTAVFVYPREGLNLWGDNLVVPKGAPNLDNAKLFLNWMMDPKNIAEASDFSGYNNAIKGSDAFTKVAMREDPAINPTAEMQARFRPVKDCAATARELRDGVWTRLQR